MEFSCQCNFLLCRGNRKKRLYSGFFAVSSASYVLDAFWCFTFVVFHLKHFFHRCSTISLNFYKVSIQCNQVSLRRQPLDGQLPGLSNKHSMQSKGWEKIETLIKRWERTRHVTFLRFLINFIVFWFTPCCVYCLFFIFLISWDFDKVFISSSHHRRHENILLK